MSDEKITVRTHCVRCGSQIVAETKIYKGKDLTRVPKLEEVHADDSYAIVHLLCDKCDMMKGAQDEMDKEDKLSSDRIRDFGKTRKK